MHIFKFPPAIFARILKNSFVLGLQQVNELASQNKSLKINFRARMTHPTKKCYALSICRLSVAGPADLSDVVFRIVDQTRYTEVHRYQIPEPGVLEPYSILYSAMYIAYFIQKRLWHFPVAMSPIANCSQWFDSQCPTIIGPYFVNN